MNPRVLAVCSLVLLWCPCLMATQWSGSVQAKFDLDDSHGYSRHETQTWTLTGGAPTMSGSVALYPATWHYTGSGSAVVTNFDQKGSVTWIIDATREVQLAIQVRSSDNKLTFHQANPPTYVAGALFYQGTPNNNNRTSLKYRKRQNRRLRMELRMARSRSGENRCQWFLRVAGDRPGPPTTIRPTQ